MSNPPAAYDVLVGGAGPAGLAAAYRAASEGMRVAVVDDNPNPGGQIWRGEQTKPSSREAQAWFERIRTADISFLYGARVFQAGPRILGAESVGGVVVLNYTN